MINSIINKLDFRTKIIGRCSCIGKDTLKIKEKKYSYKFINQQKTRLDLLLKSINGVEKPRSSYLKKYIERADIFSLIADQEALPWLSISSNINYLIMDSFSELTDKKFTHKTEGWSFAAHYSDIIHSGEFEQLYRCDGLLPEEFFYSVYSDFFNWFENHFPDVPVFFIHAPTKLDSRQLYKNRAKKILSVMKKITLEKPLITNISIDDSEVEHHSKDNFPYHFSSKTYFAFVKKWNTMVKNK